MRLFPWTLGLIVALHASAALADELRPDLPAPRDKTSQLTTLRSVHLRDLSTRDEIPEVNPSRDRWFERVEAAKGGLKYQDSFDLGGHRVRFSVRGPVQKERRLGLTFELRF
jgi:hypothetical protein